MSLKVAILGGGIGAQHLAGFAACGPRFDVRVICDLDQELAGKLAAEIGAEVSDNIDAVLHDPGIEIVDVCLPPSMHTPVAIRALEAGKHVIVEKPVAGSLVEADALRAAADRAKGRVFPVFQYRYGRAFNQLEALRAEGLLGAPLVATLETHWDRDATYYANPWRGTWERELGGAVLSHAIHSHDLLTQIFGPVAQVSAILTTRANPVETEDCAAISFRMKNGAVANSSVTLGAAGDTSRLRFVFAELTAESGRTPYAPGQDVWQFTARNVDKQADVDAVVNAVPERKAGFAGFFEAIADELDKGCDEARGDKAVPLEDGLNAIELVTAIYHADRTGTAVALPMARDLPIARRLEP